MTAAADVARKPKRPTSVHLPSYAILIGTYTSAEGKERYEFTIPSGSHQPDYAYHVNEDGSRPYCECRVRHPYTRRCALEEAAAEMAARGLAIRAGKPVPVGF